MSDKKGFIIIFVSIVSLIAVIIVCLTLVFLNGNTSKRDERIIENETITETNTPVASAKKEEAVPVVTAVPETELLPREDLYNPSLTYKRMDDIHNSYLTTDSEYEEIRALICDFNAKVSDYINLGDTAALKYLREGTTAYNQQTSYKRNHPTLHQRYDNVDVINTRKSGKYYYAWVHESLAVTENGKSKESEEYWVYKLSEDSRGMYIADYTRDPARR